MKHNKFTYRIHINSIPLEDLTQSERLAVAEKCAERMGGALNDWFNGHANEYERVVTNGQNAVL